ncbi:MAG: hypothetical protein ACXADU_11665 [Promethearchaeota archaeon]|jgi:hypothetical protein
MNYKKITIVCSLFLFLFPLTNVKAFVFVDYIKNGNYAFFLFDLGVGNSTEIRITHEDSGNFTLFLFDHRPTKAYVKDDRTLNTAIFTNPTLIAFSLDDDPYLNFTAPESKIYYIEIILASGGPDTYNLTCGEDLTRYYLPIIPGFRLEFIMLSIMVTLGSILVLYKKKIWQ